MSKKVSYRYHGNFFANLHRRAQADTRHGIEKTFEPGRIGVDSTKKVLLSSLCFILRLACTQRLGERTPERIQPPIGHLEYASDVRRLLSVEEDVGVGGVGVSVAVSLQHAQGDERIQEISRAARVQHKTFGQRLGVEGTLSKLGEQAEFDRTQERLGAPESEAELQDPVRSRGGIYVMLLSDQRRL